MGSGEGGTKRAGRDKKKMKRATGGDRGGEGRGKGEVSSFTEEGG